RDLVWEDLHKAASLSGPWNDPRKIRDEVLACLGDPIGRNRATGADVSRAKPAGLPDDFRKMVQEMLQLGDLPGLRLEDLPGLRLAATPDGEQRALSHAQMSYLWTGRKDGTNEGSGNAPLGWIHDLKFSTDGKLLVAGCDEGFAIWTVPDLAHPTCFRG